MKKVIISTTLLFAFLIVFFIIFFNDNTKIVAEDSDIILFSSEYCGHCALVKEYIDANEIENKIKFEIKDANEEIALLFEIARSCGITGDVGVPLLFDGEKCISGDRDIINFFNDKVK
ncbi:MAG: hypothetical protein PHU17_00755 [Candidatus Pacebacteria bacterium]|nr:hypothetical protein [Candidatus Paceibacterota bacterium]MDD4074051.1 hypothetical protein [Candidatus Paceibacterota bacterium]